MPDTGARRLSAASYDEVCWTKQPGPDEDGVFFAAAAGGSNMSSGVGDR